MKAGRYLLLTVLVIVLTGCSGFFSRSAENLTQALLSHDDPATVRDAAPAYLLLIDSLIRSNPESVDLLRNGADLYAAYGGVFVDDPERAKRLTQRSFNYSRRALCLVDESLCNFEALAFEDFEARVKGIDDVRVVPALFSHAQAWLAYIRADSANWTAVADLPKAELEMRKVLELNDGYRNGYVHVVLGILSCLRPPALGGKPEEGRQHFETAIEMSGGKDLSAKVEFAASYARLVFDQELHDRLLNEVLAADVESDGYTLTNQLAKQRAQQLLDTSNDYF